MKRLVRGIVRSPVRGRCWGEPRGAVDAELQKAIDARRAARSAKDIAAWDRLTASDVMEIHSDGAVHTKAQELEEIKKGKPPAVPDKPDTDTRLRVYGGSAALYTYQRNPSDGPRRVSQMWVKNASGQWQALLTQQAMIAKR